MGTRWVTATSMPSSGFSDETSQSLPNAIAAPLSRTLRIGYSQRERSGPSLGSVSFRR